MGKYLPGNPSIIVENMPGAGSMIAAKYIFNRAKPDGLTIGTFTSQLILGQILGREGFDIDTRKFEWIGAPVKDHVVCGLTKASAITSLEQWMPSKTPVKVGCKSTG
jgi:tripartite-type tricarboxylate transporter receptor subunit TctC